MQSIAAMSPLAFWVGLLVKMAITAGFVLIAAFVAQRAGALVAAMVVTLPISAGPVYVFLSLEHDARFVAASAIASMVTNAVTAIFCLVYASLAQRRSTLVSFAGAIAVWALVWFALRPFEWTFATASLLSLCVFAICVPLSAGFRHVRAPNAARRWYDLPLRAALVSLLVCVVVTASPYLGAYGSGMMAVFPIVLSSVILILHPRIGGPPTAAVIANAISGLIGFATALAALHFGALAFGGMAGVALLFAASILANLSILALRRRGVPL